MADKLDRSLDEILEEKKPAARNRRTGGGGSNNGGRRRDRDRHESYPRDGVRKSYSRDEPRNLDSEWVHDKFEEYDSRRSAAPRRQRDYPSNTASDARGSKLRVENIHYELTESELEELFGRIGPVTNFNLCYDRAGRSEGIAFVTYERREDALAAIKQYDGANAKGQPITISLLPETGRRPRNPFDTAVMPSRPLSERITLPEDRSRSNSPVRRMEEEAIRKGIDRYIPGGSNSRSRSPMPQRRGRRPGARREHTRDQDSRGGARTGGRGGRPKKTQEELDAEMADYFGGGQTAGQATNGEAQAQAQDDMDMIE
ncbi:related to RNA and export factor binding protein [Cephalotrichum gorgonifer]|uniref:Related to RNA and export factor binding protein n=1 Tax=Cephalotrichum gorgonifer TaxID=2041049 RepID=A0AAE8SQW9_9PEZI|nr:related to RNA and export factor binding protein [Cephalotrichum gorgonifer]